MQATLNGDGIIIEAEHGGGPRVTITFQDGVTINEALSADFAVRLLSGIGPRGPAGATGAAGTTFTPSVDNNGNLSWSNTDGKPNPETKNIKGPQGETGQTGQTGATGTTFTPSVNSDGDLSWTNDGGKTNPQTVNIRGPQGPQGFDYVLTNQDKADIAALVEDDLTGPVLLSKVYPVGSIYISVNNVSPATFLGGSWDTFGAGRMLVGVDTGDTDFDTVEETGGEKTHTLTIDEMPSHNHGIKNSKSANAGSSEWVIDGSGSTGNTAITNKGGGQAHNNMPPYITVYMWKRTA